MSKDKAAELREKFSKYNSGYLQFKTYKTFNEEQEKGKYKSRFSFTDNIVLESGANGDVYVKAYRFGKQQKINGQDKVQINFKGNQELEKKVKNMLRPSGAEGALDLKTVQELYHNTNMKEVVDRPKATIRAKAATKLAGLYGTTLAALAAPAVSVPAILALEAGFTLGGAVSGFITGVDAAIKAAKQVVQPLKEDLKDGKILKAAGRAAAIAGMVISGAAGGAALGAVSGASAIPVGYLALAVTITDELRSGKNTVRSSTESKLLGTDPKYNILDKAPSTGQTVEKNKLPDQAISTGQTVAKKKDKEEEQAIPVAPIISHEASKIIEDIFNAKDEKEKHVKFDELRKAPLENSIKPATLTTAPDEFKGKNMQEVQEFKLKGDVSLVIARDENNKFHISAESLKKLKEENISCTIKIGDDLILFKDGKMEIGVKDQANSKIANLDKIEEIYTQQKSEIEIKNLPENHGLGQEALPTYEQSLNHNTIEKGPELPPPNHQNLEQQEPPPAYDHVMSNEKEYPLTNTKQEDTAVNQQEQERQKSIIISNNMRQSFTSTSTPSHSVYPPSTPKAPQSQEKGNGMRI